MDIYLIILLFLYKFKFSEVYISLNIDLGPIKFLSFLDFADQTEQLWQIYSPNQDGSLHYLSNKQKQMGLQSLVLWNLWPFTDKFPIISIQIEIFRAYISLNIDLGPIKVSIILALCRSNWATLTDLVPPKIPTFTFPYPINKEIGIHTLFLWNLWPFT